jgi:hypothetical protein
LPEEPIEAARTGWRPWRAILVATVLAGLAVVLFATSALSSSGRSPDSSGGSPAVEQVQQQSPGHNGRDCPDKSGRGRSTTPEDASLDV